MVDKETIEEAVDMTKDISWTDILVPLQPEDKDLTPYPKVEYRVIESTSMDKLIRDVNAHLRNGWQTEWGIQVVSWNVSKFYQAMIRWNVDAGEGKKVDFVAKPEMPSENSEASTMGPNAPLWEGFNFLEDEEDLYEDINKDATNWETNGPMD